MNINDLLNKISDKDSIPFIKLAYEFAEEKLYGIKHNNILLIDFILNITNILIEYKADSLTIIGCLLYKTLDYGVKDEEILYTFNSTILNTINTIRNINLLNAATPEYYTYINNLPESSENTSSIFIILAKRLTIMRSMSSYPNDYKIKISQNTLDVLSPIAHKFHLNNISSTLEDLSLSYTEPDIYDKITNKLGSNQITLNTYITIMKEELSQLLQDNNFTFTIKGRVKNVYSIYNKLRLGKKWDDIYDILAIRIITDNECDCAKIIELIHSKYVPVPHRLKDYIHNPKTNMYQSIHTTIIGEDNRYYEIQVRTQAMNITAEKGSASHAMYKLQELKKIRKKDN